MSLPAAGFPGKASEKKERQMMPSPATTPKALSEQPDCRVFTDILREEIGGRHWARGREAATKGHQGRFG